jgi:S-DNA-T family DNA segregation ATPase FtsK/SpoIIIE
MASSKQKKPQRASRTAPVADGLPRPFGELLGVALLAVGALMLGGLLSYQGGDGTLMGPVGYLAAGALYASFGMASYLITLGVIGMGIQSLAGRGMEIGLGEGFGFAVATTAGCVLLHVMFPDYRVHGYTAGGLLGELVGEVSLGLFHHAGTYLVALAVMCAGLLASTPLSSAHLLALGRMIVRGVRGGALYLWHGARDLIKAQREAIERQDAEAYAEDAEEELEEELEDDVEEEEEDEEDDEEPEAGAAEEPARRRRRSSRARKPADAELEPATPAEAEPDAEDGEAVEDETAARKPARGGRRKSTEAKASKPEPTEAKASKPEPTKPSEPEADADADDELPEIVMMKHDDPPPPPAVEAAGEGEGDEGEVEDGEARTRSGKKPPLRPEQLKAARAAAAVALAPAPTDEPRPPRSSIPGVVKLVSGPYQLPPLRLFEAAATTEPTEVDRGFVLEQAQRLVATLAEFRIKGKVTKIHPGPVITRYEFKPEAGTKLSKIESLENDLAMALEAIRIRILAPIPGKSTVGFEVPNKTRETVHIKEILEDEGFGAGKRLPLALGKDITGNVTTCDLAKAPHLLVAGATGSGKSVGVNAMICSLLYALTPEDVRMVMIDPKMLELSIYEGIPHLLLPVVTDPEKASLALKWAVNEMERRYVLLSEAQVRDIAGYNRKLPELQATWEHELRLAHVAAEEVARDAAEYGEDGADGTKLSGVAFDENGPRETFGGGPDSPERPTKLPYIVVIIDEFADLMMVASKEVEQCVARIAAKARAAGIHLIVATQRPSVDVITGTIKNNFPSRIAFQVTSDVDSRTILDGKGAKQLLGMGDMLHMDRGMQPQRVHGCFVSEDEILEVVKFVKKQARPVYNMDIVRRQDDDDSAGPERTESFDPLYDRAVEIVAESQKVSTSMLQRRLNVGYNRAAKIVEAMEQHGVIGPARGTAPREVYVSAA